MLQVFVKLAFYFPELWPCCRRKVKVFHVIFSECCYLKCPHANEFGETVARLRRAFC